jgi:DNA-binding HxlR family transcriptional regulator
LAFKPYSIIDAYKKIVQRDVLSIELFAVRYALKEKDSELKPVIESLQAWGERCATPQIARLKT